MTVRRSIVLPLGVICAFVLTWTAVAARRQSSAPAPDLKTLARQSLARIDGELNVPGLKEPVEKDLRLALLVAGDVCGGPINEGLKERFSGLPGGSPHWPRTMLPR